MSNKILEDTVKATFKHYEVFKNILRSMMDQGIDIDDLMQEIVIDKVIEEFHTNDSKRMKVYKSMDKMQFKSDERMKVSITLGIKRAMAKDSNITYEMMYKDVWIVHNNLPTNKELDERFKK